MKCLHVSKRASTQDLFSLNDIIWSCMHGCAHRDHCITETSQPGRLRVTVSALSSLEFGILVTLPEALGKHGNHAMERSNSLYRD